MLLEQSAAAAPTPGPDLVAEANHRIANNLSMISGIVQRYVADVERANDNIPPARAQAMLHDIRGRLTAVGRLHRALAVPCADGAIDVGTYLQQIVGDTVSSMTKPGAVTLHFACEIGCRMPAQRTLHLGLLVLELVTNAIKHAHPAGVPGVIEIQCRRHGRLVDVVVADDGVGLPEVFDFDPMTHSGLRLAHDFARALEGTLTVTNGGFGLTCEITAPLENGRAYA